VARGCFPADARSTAQLPALAPVDSCGTSTQLVCYRAPFALGIVVLSSSSSPVAPCCWWKIAMDERRGGGASEPARTSLYYFCLSGFFCSFSRTGGLRVGSSVWVRVWLVYTSLILNTYSFPQKKMGARNTSLSSSRHACIMHACLRCVRTYHHHK
jgi:hypothetical protein